MSSLFQKPTTYTYGLWFIPCVSFQYDPSGRPKHSYHLRILKSSFGRHCSYMNV